MTELQPDTSGRRPGFRRRFVLFVSIVCIASGLFLGAVLVKGQTPGFWKVATGIVSQTFRDAAGIRNRESVLELDLSDRHAGPAPAPEQDILASRLAEEESDSSVPEILPEINARPPEVEVGVSDPGRANQPPPPQCAFGDASGEPNHMALINEVAWMGTAASPNDEWLELRNNSGADLRLNGWSLLSEDENQNILFAEKDVIPAGGFFLLERTDDDSVSGIPADKIYAGGLANSGSWLKLIDAKCKLSDEINASAGWTKFGGESSSRRTLERNVVNFDWHTSNEAAGTPKAQNFQPPVRASAAPPATSPQQNAAPAPSVSGKININTASLVELDNITGIGPTLAQRIIDYRTRNGPFAAIEDIKNVSGIGDSTFAKMEGEITVGDVAVQPAPIPASEPVTGRTNINTASFEELQGITGVGPVIAQRIIDYREANGSFQALEDVKNVKGVGDATFEKMKNEITI